MAKEANVLEASLNTMFRLNNQPTIHTLEAICRGLGISLSQFFAEDGEAIVLDKKQREMLNTWNSLNNEQKNTLLDFLKTL